MSLWVAVTLLLIGGTVAEGPAAPPTHSRIEALTHDARRPLRSGDRLTVTLRASGGGAATFHIAGVIANVGMRQIRTAAYPALPALYTGTYIVRPGDVAWNAALLATLSVGGVETLAVSPRPLTIDTRGPVIASRQPKPGATLTNTRPNIVAQVFDGVSPINPAATRLLVKGENVSARISISGSFITYNPEAPMTAGPVPVQLTVTDLAGNTVRTEWSFRLSAPDGLIRSVTINPATPLAPGDILTVVMAGAPGGRASFTVQGLAGAVAMREARVPGVYFGTITVTSSMAVFEAPLRATLELGGRRSTATAAVGVTILGGPPAAPTLASAGEAVVLGQEVVTRTILRGRSRPGLRILGRLYYLVRSQAGTEEQSLGDFAGLVSGDGTWTVALGPLIVPEGARIMASVVAIDPAGRRSPPLLLPLTRER